MKTAMVREEVREAILDAADRLLQRYGYKKTTMDDLAQEAGIGKGTIYLYFPSKEEVALSSVDRANNRIHVQLWKIARSGGSPTDRLHQMLIQRVLLRLEKVQPYAHTYEELIGAIRSSFLARRTRLLEAEAQIFADVLIEGRLLGAFNVEDAHQTAHTLLLATSGLMPFSLGLRDISAPDEIRDKAVRIADLLLHGLLRQPDDFGAKGTAEPSEA